MAEMLAMHGAIGSGCLFTKRQVIRAAGAAASLAVATVRTLRAFVVEHGRAGVAAT